MGNIGYGLGLSEPCMVAGIVSEGVAQVIDELGNPWLILSFAEMTTGGRSARLSSAGAPQRMLSELPRPIMLKLSSEMHRQEDEGLGKIVRMLQGGGLLARRLTY